MPYFSHRFVSLIVVVRPGGRVTGKSACPIATCYHQQLGGHHNPKLSLRPTAMGNLGPVTQADTPYPRRMVMLRTVLPGCCQSPNLWTFNMSRSVTCIFFCFFSFSLLLSCPAAGQIQGRFKMPLSPFFLSPSPLLHLACPVLLGTSL